MKENEIKVSIVIPVYNTGKYLTECLETLCDQTLKELQIICVDDGSTDDSVDIIKDLINKDDRIELYFHTSTGRGAGGARNYGLQFAKGEYLLILDSDDYFELDLAEKTYSIAKENDADVVLFDTTYLDENRMHLRNYNTLNKNALPNIDIFNCSDCPDSFFQITPGMAWSKLWRNEFIQSNNIIFQEDIPMADDILFTYSAMSLADRIVVLPERLINYRYTRPGNQSSNKDKAVLSSIEYAYALKQFLKANNRYDILKNSFIKTTIERSFSHLKTFNTRESFDTLYIALKKYIADEILADMDGIKKLSKDSAWDRLYENINCIITMNSGDFLFEQFKEKNFKGISFPYTYINNSDNVVLYGAGHVGKTYFNQNLIFKYCNIVSWVDRDYTRLGFPIVNPETIKNIDYDKVLIAIESKDTAKIITEYLYTLGVPDSKIIWVNPYVIN